MAKNYFEKFKKRYQKKRSAYRQVKDKSGVSSAVVNKAEKALDDYEFFFWFDEFNRPRSSRSNVMSPSDSEEDEAVVEDNDKETDEDDSDNEGNEEEEKPDEKQKNDGKRGDRKEKAGTSRVKDGGKSKRQIKKESDKLELEIMKGIKENMNKRQKLNSPTKEKDDIDSFCETMAMEIRKLGEREQHMVKHEMRNVLFKFQMAKYEPLPNISTPPASAFSGMAPTPWNFAAFPQQVVPRPTYRTPSPQYTDLT